MKINEIKFLSSFSNVKEFQHFPLPAIIFFGRSNVGKSSLINHLLQKKEIARTSSTPGKTQMFNFFLINKKFYLIDPPGYGYAKVPINIKEKWEKQLQTLFFNFTNLKLIIQIVDIRHKPSLLDLYYHQIIVTSQIPYIVIASKSDKIKKAQLIKNLKLIKNTMRTYQLPMHYTISDSAGKIKLLNAIKTSIDVSG